MQRIMFSPSCCTVFNHLIDNVVFLSGVACLNKQQKGCKMNIFLTGATGYIGGSVAQALLRAGHTVTGLAYTVKQLND